MLLFFDDVDDKSFFSITLDEAIELKSISLRNVWIVLSNVSVLFNENWSSLSLSVIFSVELNSIVVSFGVTTSSLAPTHVELAKFDGNVDVISSDSSISFRSANLDCWTGDVGTANEPSLFWNSSSVESALSHCEITVKLFAAKNEIDQIEILNRKCKDKQLPFGGICSATAT